MAGIPVKDGSLRLSICTQDGGIPASANGHIDGSTPAAGSSSEIDEFLPTSVGPFTFPIKLSLY